MTMVMVDPGHQANFSQLGKFMTLEPWGAQQGSGAG